MKRSLISVLAAAGVATIVAIMVLARGGDAGQRTAASPSLLPPALRGNPPAADAPPWPAESTLGLKPMEGATPADCDQPRHGGHWVDPARGWPWTLEALTEQNLFVAIVTAESQRGYWTRTEPGGVGPFSGPDDVAPITTTNYRVQRSLKGSLPPVVQSDHFGARKDGSFPCSSWAYEIENNPLPEVGSTYVLFIEKSLGAGRFRTKFGSAAHLPIVDGVVHSLRDVNPRADTSIHMKPEPLEAFVARFE
ncbi:MAG: hypothetical protein WEB06_15110 [Actinomycetota bacterium]